MGDFKLVHSFMFNYVVHPNDYTVRIHLLFRKYSFNFNFNQGPITPEITFIAEVSQPHVLGLGWKEQ